jgi:hypothetical protein
MDQQEDDETNQSCEKGRNKPTDNDILSFVPVDGVKSFGCNREPDDAANNLS